MSYSPFNLKELIILSILIIPAGPLVISIWFLNLSWLWLIILTTDLIIFIIYGDGVETKFEVIG